MTADEDRRAWERRGAFEVADGVNRIPLPLPGDGLRAVNVYAIEQPDGIVLVDAGWARADARDDLEAGLAQLDADLSSISRILVTHIHRDHYEQGTRIQQEFGARLELGVGERPAMEDIQTRPRDEPPIVGRMRSVGASALADDLMAQIGSYDEAAIIATWTLPDHWLGDDERVELAGRTLRVIATPGHTQGHVVFVDEDAGLLFSGDHVLPHITPSIGFEAVFADSALSDYLASLALVRGMPDLRMLPAHGPPRPTTHDRVDELLVHHDERLRQTLSAVQAEGRATAYEVAQGLRWTRRSTPFDHLDLFNRCLAVNETAAHLEVLVRRELLGAADEDLDGRTVRLYA